MATPTFKEGDRIIATLDNGTTMKGEISERKNSGKGESYVVKLDDGRLEWRHIGMLKKDPDYMNMSGGRRKSRIQRRKTRRSRKVRKTQKRR